MDQVSHKIFAILQKGNEKESGDQHFSDEDRSDEELPLECCFCSELFFEPEKFKQHNCQVDVADLNRNYKCTFDDCTKAFKKSSDLKKHERIHLNIRNFKCSYCPRDFIHQTSLKNHILTHSKQKSFVCSTCGLAFGTNGNLKQHKAKHDESTRRKFRCKICDKGFNRATNLKEHLVTHTKERSYECLTCRKTFSSSSALAKHRRIHDPFKPYCCPISECYKSFTQMGHLQKHLKSSTHLPMNVCDICDRNFRLPNALLKHMKTHDGEIAQIEPDGPKTIIISDEILVPASMGINELFY